MLPFQQVFVRLSEDLANIQIDAITVVVALISLSAIVFSVQLIRNLLIGPENKQSDKDDKYYV